jgi:hypothetical protein
MIPHQDGRPRQKSFLPTPPPTLDLSTVRYTERNPSKKPHAPLERPRHSPLAKPSVSHRPQRYARKYAVQRAHAHGDHAGKEESSKAGELRSPAGQDDRNEAQKQDEERRAGHDVEEPAHGGSVGEWAGVRMELWGAAAGVGDYAVRCIRGAYVTVVFCGGGSKYRSGRAKLRGWRAQRCACGE